MKTLLALLFLIAPLQAQDTFWQKFKHHAPRYGGYVAVGVAALMDAKTTMTCVDLPGHVCGEGNQLLLAAGINPASAHGTRQLYGFKIALISGTVLGGEFALRMHWMSERNLTYTLLGIAGTQGVVDIHNARLTERLRVPCPPTVCAQ